MNALSFQCPTDVFQKDGTTVEKHASVRDLLDFPYFFSYRLVDYFH